MTSESTINTAKIWARSPTHVLRSSALLDISRDWSTLSFLEIGAGTGSLSAEFIRRGFKSILSDIDPVTIAGLRRRFRDDADVLVVDSYRDVARESVDYLFAFEVLEHIGNDLDALQEWTSKLRRGGRLLVSVPAHQSKFGPSDARVGHVRRYEKAELAALLTKAGFIDVEIRNYGFPLTTISRLVGNLVQRGRQNGLDADLVKRSIESGQRQSGAVLAISGLVNELTMWPFMMLQRLIYRRDWGDGYVASGVKLNADQVK